MNKLKNIRFYILALLTATLFVTACSEDDTQHSPIPEKLVTAASLPPMLSAYHGQTVTVKGIGFQTGDQICFTLGQTETLMPVTAASEASGSFVLADKLATATYNVSVMRKKAVQQLGEMALKIVPAMSVPDKDGATIKGVVHSDGTPLPGVRVSDGILFTTTDNDGYYWLNSAKRNGNVFIILPSGYEPYSFDAIPQFWSALTMDVDFCERHDFDLRQVDNDNHVVMVSADLHMANRNNDLTQYETVMLPDMQLTAASQGSKRVYSIALGDMSWDQYWYDPGTKYGLPQYKNLIKNFPTMIFHTMGNHDNDPYCTDDFKAEAPYRTTLGPTYYAFNLGKVHYVVLDNIEYVNKGGAQGVVGDRNYNAKVTDAQLNWLREDLKTVSKDTPIVLCMHIPMYRVSLSAGKASATQAFDISALVACFNGYESVHCLTGHTHNNTAVSRTLTKNNIFEHNIAGASATWWWTGRLSSNHICRDGSVGGYGVFTMTGKQIDWYYKSAGKAREKQFRSYDMNKIKAYFATNSNARNYLKVYPSRENYSKYTENSVLINVWNWDEEWTIKVRDGEQLLPVTRISCEDPLHTLSYDIPRTVANGSLTSSFETVSTTHMFSVVPTSSNSTLTIEVTDPFGKTYTESMTRPKEFKINME